MHVNVPFTPLPTGQMYTVTMTPDGLSPGVITVPAGSSVVWVSTVTDTTTIAEVAELSDNPVLRPLSALNPLMSTLGWDGGMMQPGTAYRRSFSDPGTYIYTVARGKEGRVVVSREDHRIRLPVVMRSHVDCGPTNHPGDYQNSGERDLAGGW